MTLFEGEQRRLVEDFNQTKKDYPAIGIAEAFAEETQKHLTEMAASDTEGSMTYKELMKGQTGLLRGCWKRPEEGRTRWSRSHKRQDGSGSIPWSIKSRRSVCAS